MNNAVQGRSICWHWALPVTVAKLECCRTWVQAVFLGLDIVVPLMSGELLAVPKLARLYFALLSYMLDIWPARVAELPGVLVL